MVEDKPMAEVTSYRHGRVPRSVRERQIRAIAAGLFAERGYAGTSMEEICRRSGLSRPVVYDLAGSKARLFVRVLEHTLDDMAAELLSGMATSTNTWQGFRAGLTAFFAFGDANPAEFSLVISAGGGDPELDQQLLALRSRSNQRLTEIFAGLARQSGVEIDRRRLEALAHATQGACDYFARWRLTEGTGLSAETAAGLVADLLEPGLRALLTVPSRVANEQS